MEALLESETSFALNLLRHQDLSQPFVFSPLSVSLGMWVAHFVAKKETKREIHHTILNGAPDELHDNYLMELADLVNGTRGESNPVQVHMANGVFIRDGITLKFRYAFSLAGFYSAKFINVNFNDTPTTAMLINQFVAEKTNGIVEDIITPERIQEDTDTILANATSFQGRWKDRFDTHDTVMMDFCSDVETRWLMGFMTKESMILYTENEIFQVARLEFANESFAMNIFLPKIQFGLGAAIQDLNPGIILELLRGCKNHFVNLKMPKFKIETTTNLQSTLIALGIYKAFDPTQAQFGSCSKMGVITKLIRRIRSQPSDAINVISQVAHKTTIEVDEYGISATTVMIGARGGASGRSPPLPIEFIADHPFMFTITKDDHTIFMGIHN